MCNLDLAKLVTWGDSHQGVVQIQPISRLPGGHSKAHCSHKDGENMTWSKVSKQMLEYELLQFV